MPHIFQPIGDEKLRSFVFADSQNPALDWEDSYAPLLESSFGRSLDTRLVPLNLILNPDEKRKKGPGDIVPMGSYSLMIFSAKAKECMESALDGHGQFFETSAATPGFFGFHVITVLAGAVIWEKSRYRDLENGARILYRPVLRQEAVKDAYIFMLEESHSRLYVSEQFLRDCQAYGLNGIDAQASLGIETA